LDEIAIARLALGENDQVEVGLGAWARTRAFPSIARCHVRFHADDRSQLGFLGLFLELERRVEIAVVGDGERGLLEFQRPRDEVVDPIGAVEQRILGVTVQMDEGHRVWAGGVDGRLSRGTKARRVNATVVYAPSVSRTGLRGRRSRM